MYLGLKYPNVFGRVAVVSPSVWWGSNYIVHYVEAQKKKPSLRVWLDIGTKKDAIRRRRKPQLTAPGC